MLCLCQSGLRYVECCRPFHDGKHSITAEQLMRSRYCAYAQKDANYLHKTWHSTTRPLIKHLRRPELIEWLGLSIVRVEKGGAEDTSGLVEFIAIYQDSNQNTPQQLHEVSRFIKERGRWFYLDGEYEVDQDVNT